MAKNKMQDLKDHLFAQLERLNDESIKTEAMKIEIEKAKAIEGVAKQILDADKIEVDRAKVMMDAFDRGIIKELDLTKTRLLE